MADRTVVAALVVLLTAGLAPATAPVGASTGAVAAAGAVKIDDGPVLVRDVGAGLPPGVPPAARRKEPRLPAADGWPFTERFSRTSGTGRTWNHALLWTDFLYDDNGAVSGPGVGESAGAWPFGTYRYPEEDAAGNGADIFRAGIGIGPRNTYWRVDWNTLRNPKVPAAAFALDLDRSGGTPVLWGGNVGVRSAGVDTTLVVTAVGAFLDGQRVGPTTVDNVARSFVARVPRSALKVPERSTVWLAAGLANATGDAFQSLGPDHQHLPGQPNVFNMGFRTYVDEPRDKNFWFEQTQATTLAAPAADVTRFSRTVDWRALANATTQQRQPLRRGWSNRWYVSSIELGQGRVKELEGNVDNQPNYLGRVQPYAVYVPTGYDPAWRTSLTWLLHSLTINHNQYSATMPDLVRLACEERTSICATTLGRGPDGFYRGAAELDFWEVWRTLDRTYTLHPDRTAIGGFSMGGFGTFNLALDHPDAFSAMVILASAANEDLPRLRNARWLPYYHAHGTLDELVPYTEEAVPTIEELDRLGQRYVFDTYPNKDHIGWSLEDGNDEAGKWLQRVRPDRRARPGRIDYRWFPREVNRRWGIGATGAWWIRRVVARDNTADSARIRAVSLALPERPVTVIRSTREFVDDNGSAVQRQRLRWKTGPRPQRRQRMTLRLTNVDRLRVRLREAKVDVSRRFVLVATTDGPVTVRLRGLTPLNRVFVDGQRSDRSPRLAKGTHRITVTPGGTAQ